MGTLLKLYCKNKNIENMGENVLARSTNKPTWEIDRKLNEFNGDRVTNTQGERGVSDG